MVDRSEVYKALQASDISIISSLNEGFGVATIESMASGALTLATDIPIHRELIPDSDLLFTPKNYKRLSRLISRYVNEPDLALEKIRMEIKRAFEFDVITTASNHANFYRRLPLVRH